MSYLNKEKMYEVARQVFTLDDKYSISNLKNMHDHDNNNSQLKNNKYFKSLNDMVEVLNEKNLCTPGLFPSNSDNELPALDYQEEFELDDSNDNNSIGKSPESAEHTNHKHASLSKATFLQIKKYIPTADSSSSYCIHYLKTVLYMMINNKDEEHNLFYSCLSRFHYPLSSPMYAFHRFISFIFRNVYTSPEQKYTLVRICERCFRPIIKNNIYTTSELESVKLLAQIVLCLITFDAINESNDDIEVLIVRQIPEVFVYIKLFIASSYLVFRKPSEGLGFAKQSLNIKDYLNRYKAFSVLSSLATESGGQLQLAYDACYSWLYYKPVGEIEPLYTINPSIVEKEKEWRTERGNIYAALMHNNLAYICRLIGNTYEKTTEESSTRRQAFYDIAQNEIEKAVGLNPDSYLCHNTYGMILTDQSSQKRNYESALVQYEKYLKGAEQEEDDLYIVDAFNRYYNGIINLLTNDLVNEISAKEESEFSFDSWRTSEAVRSYYLKLKNAHNHFNTFSKFEFINSLTKQKSYEKTKEIFSIIDFGKDFPRRPIVSTITLILILIQSIAQKIRNELRRLEYTDTDYYTRIPDTDHNITGKRPNVKTIAYYTTLKNATFLFDELIQKKPNLAPEKKPEHTSEKENTIKSKNCLTVVHAQYMNDPYEGLTLLDSLVDGLQDNGLFPKDYSVQFRNGILKESFIFLKSFTEKVDKLFMWNRYASDYDVDGKNSNGCCIQFDPETFNRIISYPSVKEIKKENNDDTDDRSQ